MLFRIHNGNLQFSVTTKTKKGLSEVAEYVFDKFKGKCGIVYCISKKDCSNLAQILNSNGLKAGYFHSELSENEKSRIKNQWITEKVLSKLNFIATIKILFWLNNIFYLLD